MNRKIITSGLILAGCLLASNAFATVLYSDRASFSSAVGATVTDDYEHVLYRQGDGYNFSTIHGHTDAHFSSVYGETAYSTDNPYGFNIIISESNQYFCATCVGQSNLDFTGSSLSSGNGVFGIGMNTLGHLGLQSVNAMITLGDGSQQAILVDVASGFFGITSELVIRGMEIYPAATGTIGYFGIDNLTLASENTNPVNGSSGPAAIPEPASLLLLGMGLAGLGYQRRRS